MIVKFSPVENSEPDAEIFDTFFIYTARLQIPQCFSIILQIIFKVYCGLFHGTVESLFLALCFLSLWGKSFEWNSGSISEQFERTLEVKAFELFHESKY